MSLNGKEFWVQPGSEKFSVWREEPWVLLVFKGFLVFNLDTVWLDFCETEELLINILIGVGMWSSELISLTHSLLILDAIIDSQSDIVGEDWLNFSVHSLDYKIHSVEHFHLHTPFSCDGSIRVLVIHHVGWSNDSNIWEYFLDLLLSNPFGSESHTLRVWISSSGGHMNKSLNIWVGSASLGNGNWHMNVSILEVFFLLVVDVRSNDIDNSVLISDHVVQIGLASEVIKLHIRLISKICSCLDLLELPVPEGS